MPLSEYRHFYSRLTLIDGVVARQLAEARSEANILLGRIPLRLLPRHPTRTVGTNIQRAVGIISALAASASLHGVLQAVLVRPALDVVAVQAEARGVAVGVDPAAKVLALDDARVVKEFVEDRDNGDGV